MIELLVLALFPLCMVFATFSDLFTMKIPNAIVLALLAGFIVAAPFAGMSLATAGWHVGLGVAVLVAGFTMFSFGWIGGGDAKLLAVSALWLGVPSTGPYLIYAGLLGGALTIALLTIRKVPLPQPMASIGWIDRLHQPTTGVPYGAALGPAALLVFPETTWMAFASSGIAIG